ncbi:RNA polymerase sigma factor [Proteiniphilum sp. UBA5384]|uniref:RNA polymerase sigma factor n=1 Tax=Proteiniphilum sp. UBA5384 TaxID=1947279 RepID=UPI0025E75702|nr:sigma-70 family RNA polymerase sigma factor [Proteiniphilum sp. UBA5384]
MEKNKQSDTYLWGKFLEGDADAYAKIYKQTVQDLFRYGLLFSSDRELVKDCIHDVFIKIYANRVSLSMTDNVSAYLNTSLKNTIINQLKKNRSISSLQEMDEWGETGDDAETPESSYIRKESDGQLNQTWQSAMSVLSLRQREIMYYRFVKNLSIEEICKITNIQYQSVANSIQRSLIRIKNLIKKQSLP